MSHFASSGKSEIVKYKKNDTTQVSVPSGNHDLIKKAEKKQLVRMNDIPRMNTHLQPLYPLIPSIFPMALASKPPNAPARVVEEKKKE